MFAKHGLGYVDTPLLSSPTLKQHISDDNFEQFDLTKLQQLRRITMQLWSVI